MNTQDKFQEWSENTVCPSCKRPSENYYTIKDNIVEFICYQSDCEVAERSGGEYTWQEKYSGDMKWEYKEMINKNLAISIIEEILYHDSLSDACCGFIPDIKDKENVVGLLEAIINGYKRNK